MKLKYDIPAPPESALERTIELGKRQIRNMKPSRMPLSSLIALQISQFSPLYWATQLIALVCIFAVTSCGGERSARLIMLVYAGAISSLGCPELLRDISCKMSEIELSCRISGARLIAARLLIIAAANVFGLTLTAVIIAARCNTQLAMLLTAGALLLFSSAALTLLALRVLQFIQSRAAALSLSLVMSAAVGLVCMSFPFKLGAWIAACAVSLAVLAFELWRELAYLEERKGNSIWNYL